MHGRDCLSVRRPMLAPGLCAVLALLALGNPPAAQAELARGRVFLDANGNGRQDAGEAGVPGVKLSNGRELALTDARGRYRIALREGDTLFVVKPPHYRFPKDATGLPRFWKHHYPKGSLALRHGRIAPSHAGRSDFALLAQAGSQDGETEEGPRLLLLADPQTTDRQELDFHRRANLVPVQAQLDGIDLGLALGDLVNDALELYPDYIRLHAALGIPWVHVPGNHDLDLDAPDDAHSLINYRRHFGPDTLAWEFPGVALIALDDVIYQPQQRPRYVGGLREDQFRFLEQYLATLSDDTRVVLALHIPLFDGDGQGFRAADRARLFGLLQRFRRPLILSGHSHSQRHHFHGPEAGWHGPQPLHEYNVGAASGGFWSGLADAEGLPDTRMEDGSPNGYALLHMRTHGDDHSRYHASRGRGTLRMSLTSPGVLRQGAWPAHALYANVFGAEPEAELAYRIDGGPWQAMKRSSEPDPALLALNIADRQASALQSRDRAVPARPTQHLWQARLPTDLAVGLHRVEVRVRSRYEGEWIEQTHYRIQAWPP